MGFESLTGNESAKRILKNEIIKGKSSGTYLFRGGKDVNIFAYAKSFAKALICNSGYDYCDVCDDCRNIDKDVHTDVNIVESDGEFIKIDTVRKIIEETGKSSYSSGKKIFILRDASRLRKESSNALLKTIEEPPKNVYFILIANDSWIMPTIVSRSISVDFIPENYNSLGVEKNIFDFFEGNIEDVLNIKNKEELVKRYPHGSIGAYIKEYRETGLIESKVKIIGAIEDFVANKKFLTDKERLVFADGAAAGFAGDRRELKAFLGLVLIKNKKVPHLERLMEIKEAVMYNVNIETILYNFFLEI